MNTPPTAALPATTPIPVSRQQALPMPAPVLRAPAAPAAKKKDKARQLSKDQSTALKATLQALHYKGALEPRPALVRTLATTLGFPVAITQMDKAIKALVKENVPIRLPIKRPRAKKAHRPAPVPGTTGSEAAELKLALAAVRRLTEENMALKVDNAELTARLARVEAALRGG